MWLYRTVCSAQNTLLASEMLLPFINQVLKKAWKAGESEKMDVEN